MSERKTYLVDYVHGVGDALTKVFDVVSGYSIKRQAMEESQALPASQRYEEKRHVHYLCNAFGIPIVGTLASGAATMVIGLGYITVTGGDKMGGDNALGLFLTGTVLTAFTSLYGEGLYHRSRIRKQVDDLQARSMPALTHQPEAEIATIQGRDGQTIELS